MGDSGGQVGVGRRAWYWFGRVASRRAWVVGMAGVLTFLGCVLVNAGRAADPYPEVFDEYGYLLAGETFAHGRLTNPAHPLWKSMEVPGVLQVPTRQAKYQPGQGLVLALGQALTGRPIVGVWISAGLMAAALCWMLGVWFPARWASLGTVVGIAAMVFAGRSLGEGPLAYWAQTYWGGCAAALGGMLVVGGMRLAVKSPGVEAGAALGIGAGILAITRPYEGLLVAVPAAVVVARWGGTGLPKTANRWHGLARVVAPAACIVVVVCAWMGYYNWRVTGSAARFPYAEYDRQYEMAPLWRWRAVREEPAGLTGVMRQAARWNVANAEFSGGTGRRVAGLYRTLTFEVGPLLTPVLLGCLPLIVRSRWMAVAAGMTAVVLTGSLAGSFFQIHYLAPGAGLTAVLATGALRRIGLVRFGKARWMLAVPVLLVAGTVAWVGLEWAGEARRPRRLMYSWAESRAQLEERLGAMGGRYVVLVRYGARHNLHMDVVYNGAEPDRAAVLWARDLGPERNALVLAHDPGRVALRLAIEDDGAPARLEPIGDGEVKR